MAAVGRQDRRQPVSSGETRVDAGLGPASRRRGLQSTTRGPGRAGLEDDDVRRARERQSGTSRSRSTRRGRRAGGPRPMARATPARASRGRRRAPAGAGRRRPARSVAAADPPTSRASPIAPPSCDHQDERDEPGRAVPGRGRRAAAPSGPRTGGGRPAGSCRGWTDAGEVGQDRDPAGDVGEARRQRRQAEPDRVRGAEVGQDAGGDQPAGQVARIGPPDRDVRAAPGRSRGLPSVNPSGASHASWRAIAYSVSAIPFARIASIPASTETRMPSSAAASPRIPRRPREPAADPGPSAGSPGPSRTGRPARTSPGSGCAARAWRSARTYR